MTIASGADLDQSADFDIPAHTPLDQALIEWGKITGNQVMIATKLVDMRTTGGVRGRLPARVALMELLRDSELTYTAAGNTVTIGPHRDAQRTMLAPVADDSPAVPATDQQVSGDEAQRQPDEEQSKAKARRKELEEVVVTGTHIRGVPPTSPVLTIDREAIDRSGYTSVGDVIRSLPENFSGGNNPQVATGNAPTPGNVSFSGGSSPNLRGLGPGSTLTLINGHRLGQDGTEGAVDITLIPLAAVDHVEVVTDSSSAAYGSDAVAGVVNFILRKNYSGAETAVSYGNSTDGGGLERRVSQLLGGSWHGGNALLAYEYDDQEEVGSSDREFTSTVRGPTWLLPATGRNSVYAAINQSFSDSLTGTFDGLYAARRYDNEFTFPLPANVSNYSPTGIKQFLANAGLIALLPHQWTAALTASAAQQRTDIATFNIPPAVPAESLQGAQLLLGRTSSIELSSDGPLTQIGSREIRLAVGGGRRFEVVDQDDISPEEHRQDSSRHVEYGYAEVNAPLWSDDGNPNRHVDLTLSGRDEHYSDFGNQFVPKAGLLFAPDESTTVRASWSKSFRAPTLYSLHDFDEVLDLTLADPLAPGGTSMTLGRFGGNPDLKPETATSWTTGLDLRPTGIPDTRLSATYYDIRYEDRILTLQNIGSLLGIPAYAPLVIRSPSAALQQSLIASVPGEFFNYSGVPYNPAKISSISDYRYLNLSRQHLSGLDLLGDHKQDFSWSRLDVFANGSYLNYRQQVTPAAISQELAGTAFNPPRFRARAGATLTSGRWSATTMINWTGPFTNTYQPNSPPVASWTTIDAQLAYTSPAGGIFGGIRTSLSVQNLMDRNPPYVLFDGIFSGFHYDNLNATPIGRFITLQVVKSWGGSR